MRLDRDVEVGKFRKCWRSRGKILVANLLYFIFRHQNLFEGAISPISHDFRAISTISEIGEIGRDEKISKITGKKPGIFSGYKIMGMPNGYRKGTKFSIPSFFLFSK